MSTLIVVMSTTELHLDMFENLVTAVKRDNAAIMDKMINFAQDQQQKLYHFIRTYSLAVLTA